MNTVLANAQAESRIPGSVYDVLYLENEAGYILENLNPTAEGYYYAWDQVNNKIIYLMSDLQTVYFPEDYTLTEGNCWITVSSAAEAAKVAGYGYNLAFECDINEEIVLSNVVSINTLGFKAGNVTFNGDTASKSVETAYMIGTFGNIGGTLGASSIVQSGTASNLSVSSNNAASSVTVSGYVNSFSVSGSAAASVTSAGLVNSVASTSTSSITNNGVVKANSGSSVVSGGASSVEGNKISVGTKEDLDSIRTQVASGARTFDKETIELSQNVNMANIAFTPISNFYRGQNDDKYFRGTFNGNGYSILNFSNTGFSVTGLNAGFNNSSVYFGEAGIRYKEACYGLFACAKDATFENFNVTCNVDMMIDHANNWVGDSVGGIVGCGYGEITFKNCTVNGTICGYDATGGLIGRFYGTKLTFDNCTNNADITSVRRAGGLCGASKVVPEYKNNCVNNGTVTTLGNAKDLELVAWNTDSNTGAKTTKVKASTNTDGYYAVSAAANLSSWGTPKNSDKWMNLEGFTNNGNIFQGEGNNIKDTDAKQ